MTEFNTFAETTGRDDETGEPFKQAPIHKRMAELRSSCSRLVMPVHINSGATMQQILYTAWELNTHPDLRVLFVANTPAIATRIEKRVVDLVGMDNGNVCGVGLFGMIPSRRFDRIVFDNVHDPDNSHTEEDRNRVYGYYSFATARLAPNGRVVVSGARCHDRDLYGQLKNCQGYAFEEFPLIGKDFAVSWPEMWPADRIERMRAELGPAEFQRQLMCQPYETEAAAA